MDALLQALFDQVPREFALIALGAALPGVGWVVCHRDKRDILKRWEASKSVSREDMEALRTEMHAAVQLERVDCKEQMDAQDRRHGEQIAVMTKTIEQNMLRIVALEATVNGR